MTNPAAKTYNSRTSASRAAIRSGLGRGTYWLHAVDGGFSWTPKRALVVTDPVEIALWNEQIAIGYPEIVDGQIVNEPWKSNHLKQRTPS